MTNMRFIKRHAGKFVDFELKEVPGPRADEPLVIVAGYWEDMPVGAMQEKCRVCKRMVGVDPVSQGMLAQPGQVLMVLCRNCWMAFDEYRKGNREKAERIVLGLE